MSKTPVYSLPDGTVAFGLRATVLAPDSVTDQIIKTAQRHTGRPDLLAYELYGDVALWWVVPEANQMIDPITELVAGLELRAPSKARVVNSLST